MSPNASMKCQLIAVVTVCLFQILSAQQVFEKTGEHYKAKIMIHRNHIQFPSEQGGPAQPAESHSQSRSQPWRQGDRITKQEVMQNLATALLSRRKTEQEKREEKRIHDEKVLEEYRAQKIRQARRLEAEARRHPPHPPNQGYWNGPPYPPNQGNWNGPPYPPNQGPWNGPPYSPYQDGQAPPQNAAAKTREFMPRRGYRGGRRRTMKRNTE